MLLGTLVVSNILTHSKIEAYQTSTNDNNVQVESKWPERLLFLFTTYTVKAFRDDNKRGEKSPTKMDGRLYIQSDG